MDKVEEAAWVEAWLSKRFSARAWATLRSGDPEEWLRSQGVDLEPSRAARRHAMRWWGSVDVHTVGRDALPARLAQGVSTPWVRVAGEPALLNARGLAIVGARRCACPQLRGFLRELVAELGVPIVSGGALGVDTMAHEAALAAGVPCVVVVAPGLALAGPSANRPAFTQVASAGGAVLSEWPDTAPIRKAGFVRRNTHIAALASAVLVARSSATGGAMHTARAARRLGVPVLAIPGPPWDGLAEGANELIRGGATLCATLADVREAMGISGQGGLSLKRPAICLDATQRSVVDAVAAGHVTVEALCRATELTAAALQEQLLLLTLDGALVDGPRGYEVTPRVRSSALGFD